MPELAREAFPAIANCTYDWESWVGPRGETRWINPAVERMTGYSVAECLALVDYPLPLIHPSDRDLIRQALSSAADGTSGNDLEFRIQRRDGASCWGAMSWQPLTGSEGQRLGYRTSVRDITERKRMEDRLRTALARAERADRARADFLASISHELRTPLHGVLGFAELLASGPLEPQQAQRLSLLQEQGQLLLYLVDRLLDVAAQDVARAPQSWDHFSVADLVQRVVQAQRPRVEAKGLTLRLELDERLPPVTSDRHAVEQMLGNLVDNAIKFTDQGGITITVATSSTPRADVVVTVADTGRGMQPERVEELRKPFTRGASCGSADDQPGAGLGLAIVDRLLSQLGGRLAIVTEPGQGSRFTVRLPLTQDAGDVVDTAVVTEGGGLPLRVLVVDDSAVSREVAQAFLERLGCTAEVVAGAREALDRCRAVAYDLVLIDRHLPDLDGAVFAHLLRAEAQRQERRPRLVAMTADVLSHATRDAVFDDVLTKPVALETLERCLRRGLLSYERPPALDVAQVDEGRLRELRELRTADGESFWERFALTAFAELETIARAFERVPVSTSAVELARLAHSAKGAADIVGAAALATEAARAQSLLESVDLEGREAIVRSVASGIRAALEAAGYRGH